MRLVSFVLLAGCGAVSANHEDAAAGSDGPGGVHDAAIDAAPLVQHLYVPNDSATGGISQYSLPLTATSTPNFTFPLPSAVDTISDANGNLIAADNSGHIYVFDKPLSATSTQTGKFANGAQGTNGQLVLTPTGNLIAATQGITLNVFMPPFNNASVLTSTITAQTLTVGIGAALDAAGNLYIGNDTAAGIPAPGSNLLVFAPPYTSAPIATPELTGPTGAAYRKVAVSATQVLVASVESNQYRVDVYNLPITPTTTPAFAITTGVNAPEAVALDAHGNLYVGNEGNSTITVYAPPFSGASAPAVTFTVTPSAAIFGLSVGP